MLSEPRTEELIRAALTTQADRAVPGAEVLAGLDPAGNGRRNRTLGLVAVAAAVVAAVAVPIGLDLGRPAPAVSLPVSTSVPAGSVATPYQVGWVPPGYVAIERAASLDGSRYESQWRPAPAGGTQDFIQLAATAGTPAPSCAATPEPVSVGGAAGQFRVCSVKTLGHQYVVLVQVRWSPRPGWYLTLAVRQLAADATPDRTMVLRVAGSVVADPTARLDPPLTVGHVPPGLPAVTDLSVTKLMSPPQWIGAAGPPILPLGTQSTSGTSISPSVVVYWGPAETPPVQRCVTLGGDDSCTAALQQHGWWLSVTLTGPNVTEQEAMDVARSVTVHPGVTYPWLGRS